MIDNVFIYVPPTPSAQSLQDPTRTIRAENDLLVHFDRERRCAAVYDMKLHAWSVYGPMTAEEFISSLPNLGVRIADTGALQTWIDSISQKQPSGRH